MPIRRSELLEYARGTSKGAIAESLRKKIRTASVPSVFLSHSHEDRDLVEPVANFIASMGISLYVDWLDPKMPSITSAETAERIKTMIVENHRFLVLASERSLESRWVPWELGYADGEKKFEDIAILPIQEYNYKGAPNEYVQVYQEVARTTNGKWHVFQPGESKSGLSVELWLTQP